MSRRGLRALIASAATLVAIAVSLSIVGVDGPQVGATAPVAGAAVPSPPSPGVTDLGAVPADAGDEVVVWTGTTLLTFGSHATPGDETDRGATYDPVTGNWTRWPTAPFDQPVEQVAAVWTGHELVVVGTRCGRLGGPDEDEPDCLPGTLAAAAFDPGRSTWREVTSPGDSTVTAHGSTRPSTAREVGWDGERAIFEIASDRLVAYDPATDAWDALPRQAGVKCVVRDRVVASVFDDSDDELRSPIALSVFEPRAQRWRAITPPAGAGVFDWTSICSADSVYVAGRALDTLWRLDVESERWTAEPPAPRDLAQQQLPADAKTPPGFQLPIRFTSWGWSGSELVFWNSAITTSDRQHTLDGNAIAFDPVARAWRTAAPGPALYPNRHAWADGYALVLDGSARVDLFVYRP